MAGVRVSQPGDSGDPSLTPEIDTQLVTVDGEQRHRQRVGAHLLDPSGAAYDDTNRLPVDIEGRTLTERMNAKAPATGYRIGYDTGDPAWLYTIERPVGSADDAPVCRGIRVPKPDAAGNIVGFVQEASGFAWNDRGAAAWQ